MQVGRFKLLAIVLLAVTIPLVEAATEVASGASAVIVGFANATVKAGVGDTVVAAVVADPNGYAIQSGELILSYNSSGLKVVEVTPGDIWGASPLIVKTSIMRLQ